MPQEPTPKVFCHHATEWPQLIAWVQALLIEQAHRHTGLWQPQHVRLDLPAALVATAHRHAPVLLRWLRQQGLQPLVLASRRADVRLELR